MHDSSIIASSTPCLSCRYDLKGLHVDGACPECGARIFKTVPRCPRCPTLIALTPGSRRGLWHCPSCQGMGLEPGELRRAVSEEARPPFSVKIHPRDIASQLPVKCGRCDKEGQQVVMRGEVIIDRCGECGFIWLDHGELPAVVEFVRRFVGPGRLPSELERYLHDPAELERLGRMQAGAFGDTVGGSIIEVVIYFIFGLF